MGSGNVFRPHHTSTLYNPLLWLKDYKRENLIMIWHSLDLTMSVTNGYFDYKSMPISIDDGDKFIDVAEKIRDCAAVSFNEWCRMYSKAKQTESYLQSMEEVMLNDKATAFIMYSAVNTCVSYEINYPKEQGKFDTREAYMQMKNYE